jgi:outer membrane lipoprotein-sorting protein
MVFTKSDDSELTFELEDMNFKKSFKKNYFVFKVPKNTSVIEQQ